MTIDLNKLPTHALRAAMRGGTAGWGEWASSEHHVRYAEPILPSSRRRCHCGCRRRATHVGKCNGIALMEGCELTVARWLRTRAADRSALAQSDEVPDPLALEIAKEIREKPEFKEMVAQAHALAQSDAGPWRCPIGIAPESHGICSAGTCWWCLADRVKAQSDAGPREQQSEIIHLTSALREAESRIEALSDASGLIEAAKMAERNADRDGGTGPNALRHLAKVLRARAADRSGK